MNTKSIVAGMAIGSLLAIGTQATQVVRAESDAAMSSPAMGMVGGHEGCHVTMASMMWMMHQHHGMMGEGMMDDGPGGMMGEGMMDDGPGGMMGEGMMGASPAPEPEATTAPPSTAPGDQTPAPDASSVAGHEQHHPSSSPSASPGPS